MMFGDREQVLMIENTALGEFDLSAEGFYRNVKHFAFNVKKRRIINIQISSNGPVDVAVSDDKGSSVFHKQNIIEGTLGPIPTNDNKEMGIILGVYPGDKATVDLEIWMSKK